MNSDCYDDDVNVWGNCMMWSKSHRVPGISIAFLPLSTSSDGISIGIVDSGISWRWLVLMSYHSDVQGMCRLLAMLCKQCCVLWQRKLPHTRRQLLRAWGSHINGRAGRMLLHIQGGEKKLYTALGLCSLSNKKETPIDL